MEAINKRVLIICMLAMAVAAAIFEACGISIFNFPAMSTLHSIGDFIERFNLNVLLSIVLLTITNTFVVSISVHCKPRIDIVAVSAMLACMCRLSSNIMAPTLAALFGCILYADNRIKTVVRFSNLMVITGLYQALASMYKLGVIDVSRAFTPAEKLLYSLDNMVLLIAIYYDMKGGRNDDETATWRLVVYPFVSTQGSVPRDCPEDPQDSIRLSRGDWVIVVVVAIFQLGLVAAAAALNEKLIIFLIVYILGFFPQKLATAFNYHAATIGACTMQSLVAFYIAVSVVPQVGISVLLPVCAGAGIVAVIFIIQRVKQSLGK